MASNLLCPGPAKSGTTLLHYILSQCSDFVGPTQKEFCYFRTPQEIPYRSIFDQNKAETAKVFFEFSPPYMSEPSLHARSIIARRIKKELDNPLILFTIRHPVRRSISSYIHYLQSFARFGRNRYSMANRNLADSYCLTFDQAVRVDSNTGSTLSDVVQVYLDLFGEDRVIFFFLETDTKDFPRFYDFLCRKLEVETEPFPQDQELPRVLSQSELPQYFYSDCTDIVLDTGQGRFVLPRGKFFISHATDPEILDLDPFIARTAYRSQSFWTKFFPVDQQECVLNELFRMDLEIVSKLWNTNNCANQPPDYLTMPLRDKCVETVAPSAEFLRQNLREL